MGWEQKICNPTERAVFETLADPDWDFRTVSGIAKSTELPPKTVRQIIVKYPEYIGKSEYPDADDHELYYLKIPQSTLGRILTNIRRYI